MEVGTASESDVIQIEITHSGRRTFDGVLPNSVLREIWTKVFGRKLEEIEVYNFRQFPGRCLRVTFQLKQPVKIESIYPTPDFNFFHKTIGLSHLLIGKILGYHTVPEPKLGEEILLTVLKNSDISAKQILLWLGHFGETIGDHYYEKDAEGIPTGAFHVKFVLEHHIPEYLPMFGQKIRVFYAGMQRQCSNCYRSGHFKKECTRQRTDWIGYIERLLDTGLYSEDLFGNWIDVVNDKNRDRRSRSPKSHYEPPKRRYNTTRRLHDGRNNAKNDGRRGRSPPPVQQAKGYGRGRSPQPGPSSRDHGRGRSPQPGPSTRRNSPPRYVKGKSNNAKYESPQRRYRDEGSPVFGKNNQKSRGGKTRGRGGHKQSDLRDRISARKNEASPENQQEDNESEDLRSKIINKRDGKRHRSDEEPGSNRRRKFDDDEDFKTPCGRGDHSSSNSNPPPPRGSNPPRKGNRGY